MAVAFGCPLVGGGWPCSALTPVCGFPVRPSVILFALETSHSDITFTLHIVTISSCIMRLLRLQGDSVICLYFVTTAVMTANAPEYSEGSVTDDDAGKSKRQFSALADTILPMIADTWALAVNPVINGWRMATGIDSPGLYFFVHRHENSQIFHSASTGCPLKLFTL